MTPQTFIYARQSLPNEEGVARQLTRCRALAKSRGWDVAREFADDGRSATKARGVGTEWDALRKVLRPGDRVIAVDLDRLTRTLTDFVVLLDAAAVVVTVDGEVDLSSADGEFRATLLASLARFEMRRKSERQLRANEHRAATGRPVPTRRRYGYEGDGVTPRESEAAVVRRLYVHVLEGRSLRSAVAWLRAEDVDPAPGKSWSARRVKDILTNPHNVGRVVRRGEVLPSDVVVPIVDEETFEAVGALLRDPTRRTSPGTTPRHLLSGLVACGVCGHPLSFMRGYLCRADLSHVFIGAEKLEPVVLDHVATALLTSGADLFLPPDGTPGDVAELVAAHEKNAARVREVLADRDADLVPADVARERLTALRDERHRLEADLEAARAASSDAYALHEVARSLVPDAASVTMPEWTAMKAAMIERFNELDLDVRRDLVRALVAVQVEKGRALDRVRVTHLLAAHLNEAGAEDFDAE